MKNYLSYLIFTFIFLIHSHLIFGQCIDELNIYSFVINDKTYEIVKENRNWEDAAACAVERGGMLAEINDESEQNAIFSELNANANISVNNTVAPDGGGGSYVWLGGNDLSIEGNWVWDGNNDGTGEQFWSGDFNGSPVGGLYNNWGDEPDDFGGQDALGLSLNGWPLGSAGEWNDVDHTNTLYFIIEYPTVVSSEDLDIAGKVSVSPNPITDYLIIETDGINLSHLIIFNSSGQLLEQHYLENDFNSQLIDTSHLGQGMYWVSLFLNDSESITKKIIK